MKTCTVQGCEKAHAAKGMCSMHYMRLRTKGTLDGSRPTPTERFWAKVNKSDSCWEWTAGKTNNGHGMFGVGGRSVCAHRYSYELEHGPIPSGLLIDHVCHNKACVNPAHLRLATNKQNMENRGGLSSRNKSGVRGVYWDQGKKAWRAQANHSGKNYTAGYYSNISEAEEAAIALRNELFTHNDADRRAA